MESRWLKVSKVVLWLKNFSVFLDLDQWSRPYERGPAISEHHTKASGC